MDASMIVSVGTLVVVFIGLIVIAKRGGSISAGVNGIEVNAGKNAPLPRHARCPGLRDVMRIMESAGEAGEQITQIKNNTIEEQMKFAEATSLDVTRLLLESFSSLLGERIKEEVVVHPEFTQYQATVRLVTSILKDYLRKWFRENHYAEKGREEEIAYIEQKVRAIVSLTTESFNTYWRGTVIPRSDLYKLNKSKEDAIMEYLTDIFRQAFLIARDGADEIAKVKERHEELARTTITGK